MPGSQEHVPWQQAILALAAIWDDKRAYRHVLMLEGIRETPSTPTQDSGIKWTLGVSPFLKSIQFWHWYDINESHDSPGSLLHWSYIGSEQLYSWHIYEFTIHSIHSNKILRLIFSLFFPIYMQRSNQPIFGWQRACPFTNVMIVKEIKVHI